MTIVTQLKPEQSSPGRVVLNSRCHGPSLGIDEDPVVCLPYPSHIVSAVAGADRQTGSAHAYLTAYYLLTSASSSIPRYLVPGDIQDLVLDAKQVSARGGALECKLAEEEGIVAITGTACEMAKGTLSVW